MPFGNENAIFVPVWRKKMPFGNEIAIFVPVWLGEAAVLQKESLSLWVLVPAMDQYGRRHASGQFSNLLLEGLERIWEVHKFLPDPKSIIRIIDIS
jgi:hypothetical protein